jgi:hypothetical protein
MKNGEKVYVKQAHHMHNNALNTLYVDFSDVDPFFPDIDFGNILINGYYRYEPYLRKAVHNFIFKLYPETKESDMFFVSFYKPKLIYKYFFY